MGKSKKRPQSEETEQYREFLRQAAEKVYPHQLSVIYHFVKSFSVYLPEVPGKQGATVE